jgi:acyl-CoA hydrolase
MSPVACDSIAHKFYGGVWTDTESILGAKFSKGGKPIVILNSMSFHGRSNIVFALPPGTGVTITRSDVEYVVTEYGTAYLYSKSIRERGKFRTMTMKCRCSIRLDTGGAV